MQTRRSARAAGRVVRIDRDGRDDRAVRRHARLRVQAALVDIVDVAAPGAA